MKDNCTLFAPTPLYAAAKLYSMATWQRPRSTERISSYACFQRLQRLVL